MARLKDVAYLAGYDVSTISKVLNGNIQVSQEARDRIYKAAEELGYRPNALARGLRMRRSGAVVFAVPQLGNPNYPALTAGAETAAQTLGLSLFAYKYPHDHGTDALLGLVHQGRVDGILMADDLPDSDFLDVAREAKVPVVTLNRHSDPSVPTVALDDQAGFSIQAAYLRGLGHRRIAFVAVHPKNVTSELCTKAFRDACANLGAPIPDTHVLSTDFEGTESSSVLTEILTLEPRPTAVATGSLISAIRIIQGLAQAGVKVAEEMSVIGYHDSPTAEWITPQATTIRMPSFEQGRRGVETLFALINGADVQSSIIGTPIMVVERGSCARAPDL